MLRTKIVMFEHEYEMFSVKIYVTHRNVICPNIRYTRKYVSKLILHTKMCNDRTHITDGNLMSRVRTYAIIQNV